MTILAPGANIIHDLFHKNNLPDEANGGLVFDRYLNLWDYQPEGIPKRQKTLRDSLEKFVQEFNILTENTGRHEMLDMIHARRKRVLVKGCRTQRYTTVWRLSTGLGTDHPSENGFVFDPVTGIPMLPGSGIKGLCREAARILSTSKEAVDEFFGPEVEPGNSKTAAQGILVFYDAYPTNWPRLCVDIVNCHYPSYYRGLETLQPGEKVVPDETESPVPVFFLALDSGVTFDFWIGVRRNAKKAILDEAFKFLDFGLTILGFGAKTAVGYGVMESYKGNKITNVAPVKSSWLENTVKELMKSHNARKEEILRSTALAEAWMALTDVEQKRQTLKDIRDEWQTRGWWDNPRGKAIKKAFKIYSEFKI